ncbi:MAG: trehalose-phosphatase [Acidimicrobiia bacterium]|nr:trehalose-phosphatase [Acidimicrobiia bacterium]
MLTDFDGTLSLIVEDPLAAVPVPGAVDALLQLAERYRLVGVVSGRPVAYLRARLRPAADRLWLSGLYGLEGFDAGRAVEAPGVAPWRDTVAGTVARARSRFGDLVEDKGLSVTLHVRTAPERDEEVRAWAGAEAVRTGLAVRPAKASVELHPPLPSDKGTVIEAAAAGLAAVCFLGDDLGDLPAFDALDRLGERGVATVKVAVRTAEAPSAVLDRADVVVDGPEGALALLVSELL